LKNFIAGYKVGLAIHLDEHRNFTSGVHVGNHLSLFRLPSGFLLRNLQTALPEDLVGLFKTALRLGKRPLAIHNTGACQFSEPQNIVFH
jgi:hypothetical protein